MTTNPTQRKSKIQADKRLMEITQYERRVLDKLDRTYAYNEDISDLNKVHNYPITEDRISPPRRVSRDLRQSRSGKKSFIFGMLKILFYDR